jgi:hypothetical protein
VCEGERLRLWNFARKPRAFELLPLGRAIRRVSYEDQSGDPEASASLRDRHAYVSMIKVLHKNG